jgi:predicted ATP-grasp superfamily ATP-dependent carboligase
MLKAEPILIGAASGRALAASARRGGYLPLVADFFGDADTIAIAHAHRRLNTPLGDGIDGDDLIEAFEMLAASAPPKGVVCGTGFEDRPQILARLAARWRLLGNRPEIVASVKDPLAFASLCRECDVPHPETSLVMPTDPTGWLIKRRGGAGGSHVGAAGERRGDARVYFQRRVRGAPVSALLLGDGRGAAILGFSEQWSSPTARQPFRYGGAVRPAAIAPTLCDALTAAVRRLAGAIPLLGLNSADFLVDGENFWILEINTRPSATLEIFEPPEESLFALHVAACEGELVSAPPELAGAAAAAIAYARDDIAAFPALDWPDWAHDRPWRGSAIKAGEPLCTVHASAPTPAGARALVAERLEAVLAWTHARMS